MGEDGIDDLTAYKRLIRMADELKLDADRCHSPAAATAINAASHIVRLTASGLYRNSIAERAECVRSR